MNTSNMAQVAFIAMGISFTSGKKNMIKSPMKVGERRKERGEPRTTAQLLKARTSSADKPAQITLQTAVTTEDYEQAWRKVRSFFGMEIFLEFDLGTPGQTLAILVDSGSDWFWVTNSQCRLCGGHTRFDHKLSSSYKDMETNKITLSYGSGDLKGYHI